MAHRSSRLSVAAKRSVVGCALALHSRIACRGVTDSDSLRFKQEGRKINSEPGCSHLASVPAQTQFAPAQGVASMTTRKQVAIVMLAMFALFAVGQVCLLTLPLVGR